MLRYGKGYLRTLEAVIAIVVILLFIYTVTPKGLREEARVPANVESSQKFIFEEVSFNDTIRDCLMSGVVSYNCKLYVNNTIERNLPFGYEYNVIICSGTVCTTETPFDKDVYMSDIFVSSSLDDRNPKIVRIYMWKG